MSARKLACIIGWPVARSLSPAIHNAAFAALGLDWTYVPLAVRPGAIEEGMGLVHELGVEGANVTMPHKQTVIPFLERLEGDAQTLGAVNTIVREGSALVGFNTDGAGFLAAIRDEAAFDPSGKRALVLGAGGAARALAGSQRHHGAMLLGPTSWSTPPPRATGCRWTRWPSRPGCSQWISSTCPLRRHSSSPRAPPERPRSTGSACSSIKRP